ncbi:MAG: alkaline phosphatase family protein [Actinomycetaceae bacterium]|nr:alkaline phosphatase family protein [Actinomycetaceae bacterium]MDU0969407.1 alkaline phosphatase family protein [Actinomycetaceae bacterium]
MRAANAIPPALAWGEPGSRPTRIPDVMGAVRASLGLGETVPGCVFPQAKRAIVVLVDGMGWSQVGQRLAYARSFLRGAWDSHEPIRTTLPSTTASAITSLMCEAWPGATNMLGYEVVDPSFGPFTLITFTRRGTKTPVPTTGWNRVPTVFERVAKAGGRAVAVAPARFADSGLTLQALKGASMRFAGSIDERVDAALAASRDAQLTYLYFEHLDHVGHKNGWDSPAWLETLDAIDHALAQLARRLPRDTLLVVTADHGMVNPDPASRVDLATSPLATIPVTLGGEPRALHVHVDRGADVEAAQAAFADYLGEAAIVVGAEELPRWIGPIARPELAGDFWVFATGDTTVVDSRVHTPMAIAMKGVHGSVSDDETLIPLLVDCRD